MRRASTFVSMIFVTFLLLNLQAQENSNYEFSELDGIWVSVKTGDHAFSAINLLMPDQRIVLQKREAIFEILRNSAVLNPLKGVAVRAEKKVIGRADRHAIPNSKGPVEMQVGMTIGHFYRERKTGIIKPNTIEQPRIEIQTNDYEQSVEPWKANGFFYEALVDDEQDIYFFLEPQVVAKTDAGLNIYYLDPGTELVLLTNGRPLWIPVTKEQFLKGRLSDARNRREKENEQSRMSKADPVPEEISVWSRMMRGFQKELAALGPEERLQPAYYLDRNEEPLHSGLAQPGDRGARMVVRMNPDYFNRSLPRTAIQQISCYYYYQVSFSSGESYHLRTSIGINLLNRLAKQLEYDKLSRLIEK